MLPQFYNITTYSVTIQLRLLGKGVSFGGQGKGMTMVGATVGARDVEASHILGMASTMGRVHPLHAHSFLSFEILEGKCQLMIYLHDRMSL